MARSGTGVKSAHRPRPETPHRLVVLLAAERESRGLTQHELARRSGLCSKSISGYERGHFVPSVEAFTRLAEGCGLRVVLVDEHGREVTW